MNWGEARKTLALVFINAIAFYFDAEWLTVAIGVDLLALGYELKNHVQQKGS